MYPLEDVVFISVSLFFIFLVLVCLKNSKQLFVWPLSFTTKYARALQRVEKIIPLIVDTYRMVHMISRKGPVSLIMALPMFYCTLVE